MDKEDNRVVAWLLRVGGIAAVTVCAVLFVYSIVGDLASSDRYFGYGGAFFFIGMFSLAISQLMFVEIRRADNAGAEAATFDTERAAIDRTQIVRNVRQDESQEQAAGSLAQSAPPKVSMIHAENVGRREAAPSPAHSTKDWEAYLAKLDAFPATFQILEEIDYVRRGLEGLVPLERQRPELFGYVREELNWPETDDPADWIRFAEELSMLKDTNDVRHATMVVLEELNIDLYEPHCESLQDWSQYLDKLKSYPQIPQVLERMARAREQLLDLESEQHVMPQSGDMAVRIGSEELVQPIDPPVGGSKKDWASFLAKVQAMPQTAQTRELKALAEHMMSVPELARADEVDRSIDPERAERPFGPLRITEPTPFASRNELLWFSDYLKTLPQERPEVQEAKKRLELVMQRRKLEP